MDKDLIGQRSHPASPLATLKLKFSMHHPLFGIEIGIICILWYTFDVKLPRHKD